MADVSIDQEAFGRRLKLFQERWKVRAPVRSQLASLPPITCHRGPCLGSLYERGTLPAG